MTMTRRPPQLADLDIFRDAIERMFDERAFRPFGVWNGEREAIPALDLYMTPDAVVAKIALPGITADDIDVTIADDVVTVRASFEAEKETPDAGYVRKELKRGSLERSFALPTAVRPEAASAMFRDGLLTLTLPKTEEVKPTHIKVEVSG